MSQPGIAILPAAPVLPSRLTPPAVRHGVVARPALNRRLGEANSTPVVAVIAPPGYGKTTLLAEWASRDPRAFAWLAAERHHYDPAVLVSYLAAALATVIPVDPAVFDDLVTPRQPRRAAAVGRLAVSVAGAPQPFVLALDDVHLLSDPEGLAAITTLVDHLPVGSQLAIAGRREPMLGLPRLRSEDRVLDISTDDLRLDLTGARELLAAAGVNLPDSQLSEVMSRTEGWPVGLYFAALAGNPTRFPRSRPDAFDGDDRLLADYIRSEFLSQLPEDQVRFLTRTSVLDEMSGPLCDTVLHRGGSAATLEEIEASNLLLVPLDRQRRWYRYHRLFQGTLRHELDRTEPEAVPELALRASHWCEGNDLVDRAMHYAQLAADVPRASQIVVRNAMRLFAMGRAATLRQWFGWLAAHDCRDGAVAVLGAWLNLLGGRPAEAEHWAALAYSAPLDRAELPDGSALEGWVLTLRVAMARDVRQMADDAGRALRLLSPTSQWRPIATVMVGLAEYYQGNLEAADSHLAESVELGAELRAPGAAVIALACRAVIAIHHDLWRDADRLLNQASSLINAAQMESYPICALAYVIKARVAAHLQDPWSARRQLSSASKLLPGLTRVLATQAIHARLEFVRACITLGDTNPVEHLLTEAGALLRDGQDFGLLHADADELAAVIARARAISTRLPNLTPAEVRLLPLLATHLTYRQIAERLTLSVHTVKAQVTSIYNKLEVTSRAQAIEQARSVGLLSTRDADIN